jgi:hypothetical protein
MDQADSARVPTSYWVISILGALWNSFGAYLYTMTNLGNKAMIAAAPPAMQAYIANMPIWAHTGWALGIWGSFAGSALMLLRSRHAGTAFLVSLVGAVISYGAQALAGVLTLVEPVVILSVIAFLWRYSATSAASGIQR